MKVKRVLVMDEYDGFRIRLIFEGGNQKEFGFNQEDTREGMIAVFKAMGVEDVIYEEVC